MGIRFQKSISLGKFFRLNFSKSGVSIGVGPRGLNVNMSPRGVRETIGLPGTGIYYQESHRWPKSSEGVPLANSAEGNGSGFGLKIFGAFVAIIAIAAFFGVGSFTTAPKNFPATLQSVKPLQQVKPPTSDRPLNREEVLELQTLLRKQGFDIRRPDGVIGPKTRAAVQAFVRAHQINDVPGGPSLRVLNAARSLNAG